MSVRALSGAMFAVLLSSSQALPADSAAPWITGVDVAHATEADIARQGAPSIKNHAEALENVLAEGAKAFPPPPAADGTVTLLTDGPAQTKAALAAAAAQRQKAVAVDNPFPRIGFYLGTFYNDSGRPLEALRVLDLGLKLTSGDPKLGEQMPNLYTETGFSLEILKRWAEGLQICQAGLNLPGANRSDRARMYRCAGYCLAELSRFDEAATAYRAAIRLDPDDTIAPIELEFVLRNRASNNAPPP